jgi:hypothetical protein
MEAEALAMHADDAEEKVEQEMKSAPKPKGAAKGKVGHRISLPLSHYFPLAHTSASYNSHSFIQELQRYQDAMSRIEILEAEANAARKAADEAEKLANAGAAPQPPPVVNEKKPSVTAAEYAEQVAAYAASQLRSCWIGGNWKEVNIKWMNHYDTSHRRGSSGTKAARRGSTGAKAVMEIALANIKAAALAVGRADLASKCCVCIHLSIDGWKPDAMTDIGEKNKPKGKGGNQLSGTGRRRNSLGIGEGDEHGFVIQRLLPPNRVWYFFTINGNSRRRYIAEDHPVAVLPPRLQRELETLHQHQDPHWHSHHHQQRHQQRHQHSSGHGGHGGRRHSFFSDSRGMSVEHGGEIEVNYIDVKPRLPPPEEQELSPAPGEFTVEARPRMPDWINPKDLSIPKPVTVVEVESSDNEDEEWTLPTSIFAERRQECDSRSFHETDSLLTRAFESDWKKVMPKLKRVIKEDNALKQVQDVLRTEFEWLVHTYRFYASQGTATYEPFSVKFLAFSDLCNDCMIITDSAARNRKQSTLPSTLTPQSSSVTASPPVPPTEELDEDGNVLPGSAVCRRSDIDTVFIATNVELEEQGDNDENADNAVERFEFLEAVVRIALVKFFKKPVRGAPMAVCASPAEATERLLQKHLAPHGERQDPREFREDVLYTERMEDAFTPYLRALRGIFEKHARQKQKTYMLSLANLVKLLSKASYLKKEQTEQVKRRTAHCPTHPHTHTHIHTHLPTHPRTHTHTHTHLLTHARTYIRRTYPSPGY